MFCFVPNSFWYSQMVLQSNTFKISRFAYLKYIIYVENIFYNTYHVHIVVCYCPYLLLLDRITNILQLIVNKPNFNKLWFQNKPFTTIKKCLMQLEFKCTILSKSAYLSIIKATLTFQDKENSFVLNWDKLTRKYTDPFGYLLSSLKTLIKNMGQH